VRFKRVPSDDWKIWIAEFHGDDGDQHWSRTYAAQVDSKPTDKVGPEFCNVRVTSFARTCFVPLSSTFREKRSVGVGFSLRGRSCEDEAPRLKRRLDECRRRCCHFHPNRTRRDPEGSNHDGMSGRTDTVN
jgi:hypothetical protein